MAVFRESVPRDLRGKMMELNWTLVLLLVLLGAAGVGMLYSVAGGSWDALGRSTMPSALRWLLPA